MTGGGSRPPVHVAPMLAVAGALPRDPRHWAFEFKWDGVRLIAHWVDDHARFESRRLRDVTATYPELAGLTAQLGPGPVVLDGEVVALDDGGRPSFQLLQERMNVADGRTATARAAHVPVVYLVFDVLWLGRSTMELPYTDRRRLLEDLGLGGDHWHTPPAFPGEGDAALHAAGERGLEGVVAKRLDSTYRPGARSGSWLKVKLLEREEFVVGGWMPGEGNRAGRLGALLVGRYGSDGRLHYNGSVGTGYTERMLRHLGSVLEPLRRPDSPFAEGAVRPGAVYVEPELVAEVEYRERTRDGILRQPSFKGLRDDKAAADVIEGPDGPGGD